MSYHIYTTRGIVLSERPIGEADRIYNILTRELGKLQARGIGVRKNNSKLRGNIEPFSLSSISFVKGKEYWRITSAEFIKSISRAPTMARPLVLIERLIQGQKPHSELFDLVEQFTQFVEADNEMFEVRLVSQILFHLGYLRESDLALDKKALIEAINEGLQASHL